MPRRVEDWVKQAEKDLKHARNSIECRDYEWACFAAQQASEKILKALYQSLGGEPYGHSLTKLIRDLPKEIKPDNEMIKAGMELDKFYIPTRYPNGFDSGSPMDYYSVEDAKKAVEYAEHIFSFIKTQIRK